MLDDVQEAMVEWFRQHPT